MNDRISSSILDPEASPEAATQRQPAIGDTDLGYLMLACAILERPLDAGVNSHVPLTEQPLDLFKNRSEIELILNPSHDFARYLRQRSS